MMERLDFDPATKTWRRSMDYERGWFYLLQMAPAETPLLVKMGYAQDPDDRFYGYSKEWPSWREVKRWSVLPFWERPAIAKVTLGRCEVVPRRREWFIADDIEALRQRIDTFFATYPVTTVNGHAVHAFVNAHPEWRRWHRYLHSPRLRGWLPQTKGVEPAVLLAQE